MATEKRLIDANELGRKTNKLETFYFTGETDIAVHDCQMVELGAVLAEIDEAPTVDAVEVVRCKDCRWARPQDHREPTDTPGQMLICQCFKNHHIPAPWGARLAVNPEHYCSYGERRANGQRT